METAVKWTRKKEESEGRHLKLQDIINAEFKDAASLTGLKEA